MAIGADDFIEKYGTQDTPVSSTAAVTDGSFSAQEDTWTNDDDAPFAAITFSGTYTSAPDAGSVVELHARLLNIDSTNDEDTPDANFMPHHLGNFALNDVTSAQYVGLIVKLPNTKSSQEYEFYIRNQGGQTLSAGWEIKVTPIALGPHA